MGERIAFVEVGKTQGMKMTVAEIKSAIASLRAEKSQDGRAFILGLQEALSERLATA